MTTQATGQFKVESWNEDTYAELQNGGKLTRADVKQSFSGDIEGEGAVEWLMCYGAEGTADYVGLQRVDGRIGDRSGTLVLQVAGTFDGQEARGTWSVVPGSGSDELRGLKGEGEFSAPLGSSASFTLGYEIE
jgi:hypothetical protein